MTSCVNKSEDSLSLWSEFVNNKQRTIHKWKHYFPAYEAHFSRFVNRPMVFLEIGCGRGGSAQMWKRYLGPHALIVGIDVKPESGPWFFLRSDAAGAGRRKCGSATLVPMR